MSTMYNVIDRIATALADRVAAHLNSHVVKHGKVKTAKTTNGARTAAQMRCRYVDGHTHRRCPTRSLGPRFRYRCRAHKIKGVGVVKAKKVLKLARRRAP